VFILVQNGSAYVLIHDRRSDAVYESNARPLIVTSPTVDAALSLDIARFQIQLTTNGPTRLHLVTFGTDQGQTQGLLDSVDRSSLSIQNLCEPGMTWLGFGQKLQAVEDYIKGNGLSDDSVVIFVDAYDAFVLEATEDEILQRFMSFQKPLFTSTCLYQWPPRDADFLATWHDFTREVQPPFKSPYTYLCSGVWGGLASQCLHFLSTLPRDAGLRISNGIDDQAVLQDYTLAYPDNVAVDYQCVMSMSTGRKHEAVRWSNTSPRVLSISTQSTPPILHVEVSDAPKWDIDPIREHIMSHEPIAAQEEVVDVEGDDFEIDAFAEGGDY
jgi:hypothetical protein